MSKEINKKDIVYWLEQIFNAVGTVAAVEKNQSDWEETDNTDPAYIKNKPTVPAVGAVVEGTVAEDAFTPAAGAPAFADILALVAEPAVVYLNYSSTYDMVVSASASLIKTAAGVEWAAE